jgi:TolA-binding protein
MTGDTTPEQLRQELRDLDAEIAELRVSEQPADTEDEVRDSEEIAADLTTEEEQQAILGILERRRDTVRERLRQLGTS